MGKILIIAEKPNIANLIAKALTHRGKFVREDKTGYYEDDKYIITNALGHLFKAKLPSEINDEYKKWNINLLPFKFDKLDYIPKEDTSHQVDLIKKLLVRNDIEEICNACDSDREGELLFREILIVLHSNTNKYTRLWLESISSSEAIKKSFDERLDLSNYDNLFLSALARQFADYHVGLNATMGMSAKMRQKYTLGRVQTPTLKIVVDRELEILNFNPIEYYNLKAICEGFEFTYFSEDNEDIKFKTKEDVMKKCKEIGLGEALIKTNEIIETKEYPSKLFSLSDLQVDMSEKYGYEAQQVLNICQALYETYKITTYPRTDENFITEATLSQIDKIIDSLPNLFINQVNYIKSNAKTINSNCIAKKEIGSHEALQPVVSSQKISDEVISSLKEEELNVYKAIVERFLSNFYDPAIYIEQKVIINKNNNTFKYTTKALKDYGYLRALSSYEDKEREEFISKTEGEFIRIDKFLTSKQKTKPKPRFTSGTLIKAMKNPIAYLNEGTREIYSESIKKAGGIGTEATRGQIIEDLKKRGFIALKGKSLFATTEGIELIQILPSKKLKEIELTSTFEANLELIKDGKYNIDEFKETIHELDRKIIDEMREISSDDVKSVKLNTIRNNSICKCTNCVDGYILKGKNSYYCSNNCGVNINFGVLKNFGYEKDLTDKNLIDLLENKPSTKVYEMVSKKTEKKFKARIMYEFDPNSQYKNKFSLVFVKERKAKDKTK